MEHLYTCIKEDEDEANLTREHNASKANLLHVRFKYLTGEEFDKETHEPRLSHMSKLRDLEIITLDGWPFLWFYGMQIETKDGYITATQNYGYKKTAHEQAVQEEDSLNDIC